MKFSIHRKKQEGFKPFSVIFHIETEEDFEFFKQKILHKGLEEYELIENEVYKFLTTDPNKVLYDFSGCLL